MWRRDGDFKEERWSSRQILPAFKIYLLSNFTTSKKTGSLTVPGLLRDLAFSEKQLIKSGRMAHSTFKSVKSLE